jgi:manganese/zinc/iron transport system permease protein
MEITIDQIWIISISILVGASCSLVGVFLVLRKLSMLGDAISHSVLFGIVVAFLLTGQRTSFIMIVGAGAVGVLTAFLTDFLNKKGSVQKDASIGVIFTWLFALGVILISLYAGQVDLDQDCVLNGEIAFAPLDVLTIGGHELGPRTFWSILIVFLINSLTIFFGYKKIKTLTFDPIFAATTGIQIGLWHYILMTLTSITTVASFDSVGAILVVAMLVIPANTAYLYCHNLGQMIWHSLFFSTIASIGGYYLAMHYDSSISAAIAICLGLIFVITLIITKNRSLSLKITPNHLLNQK